MILCGKIDRKGVIKMSSTFIIEIMILCAIIVTFVEGGLIESKLDDIMTEMKKMEWHLDRRNDDGK